MCLKQPFEFVCRDQDSPYRLKEYAGNKHARVLYLSASKSMLVMAEVKTAPVTQPAFDQAFAVGHF